MLRQNRIKAGEQLYQQLDNHLKECNIDDDRIDFDVHSYGIEVFMSFLNTLKKNHLVENRYKIGKVILWESPVIAWTWEQLKNIDIDTLEDMTLYYSDNDWIQVCNITQAFNTWKFWKWRLFYAIRRTLLCAVNKIKKHKLWREI